MTVNRYKNTLSRLRVVMSVTVTEAVNDDVHIFQISGFHFRARRYSVSVNIFVGNAHDLWFPSHRTRKH